VLPIGSAKIRVKFFPPIPKIRIWILVQNADLDPSNLRNYGKGENLNLQKSEKPLEKSIKIR
jgi:hypothetical protein